MYLAEYLVTELAPKKTKSNLIIAIAIGLPVLETGNVRCQFYLRWKREPTDIFDIFVSLSPENELPERSI